MDSKQLKEKIVGILREYEKKIIDTIDSDFGVSEEYYADEIIKIIDAM